MQRIFIALYSLFVCTFAMNPLTAITSEESQETKNNLRILELLPNLLYPLAVDPSIPTDFIAASPRGTIDVNDWIYWGPKEVLKEYFANPDSLKVPVLRIKLSANVAQTGPNSFSGGESLQEMKKNDPKGFASIATQWGDYPVLAVRTRMEGKLIFMAWVGLNDPEAGWALLCNLVYPEKEGHPNEEDRKLWENFIKNTTQLKERDYFKVGGQDLQEGYTLVNVGGAKLKMIAEKRQSDGMVQVVVIPESPNVEFQYVDMMECLMGAKWRHGEPMVKVYGSIINNNENANSITSYVTSIFFKNVKEFSFKKDDDKKYCIFTKNCTTKEAI